MFLVRTNIVRKRTKPAGNFGFPFNSFDRRRIDKGFQSRVVKRAIFLDMPVISDRTIPDFSICDSAAAHPFKLPPKRSEWPNPAYSDQRALLRLLEIKVSQGAEWKALISNYIGSIPLSGDASCAAGHVIAICPPPVTPVSSAMTRKAGAAARHSQSAAPRAAALPPS